MLDTLRLVSPDQLGKMVCFDADSRDFDPTRVPAAPDHRFIDGEHTRAAALSDCTLCLRICAPNAAICFYDDDIIAPALREIVSDLRRRAISARWCQPRSDKSQGRS